VAVEPVGARDARDVTNEAIDPPASPASERPRPLFEPLHPSRPRSVEEWNQEEHESPRKSGPMEPTVSRIRFPFPFRGLSCLSWFIPGLSETQPDDRARAVTNEASGPATSRPSGAEPDDGAGNVTTKASGPAEGAARPVAAGPAVIIALLAPLFSAGLTAAFGASAQARDPSPIATQEQRTSGGPASSRAGKGWPRATRTHAGEDVVPRPEDDHPVRPMSPDDNDIWNQPIRLMDVHRAEAERTLAGK
jgi:hypothetical protein